MSEASPETTLAKLKIDGTTYDVPAADDFTLGESVILKNYTGKNLSEIEELSGDDPRFLSALILIVLKRVNPSITETDVANIKLTAVDSADEAEPEADVSPPDDGATQETEEIPEDSGVPA